MEFPPQSPDVNPIEHLWVHLKREKIRHAATSKERLWKVLCQCWNSIEASTLQNLVRSMSKRVQAILKAKGGHTNY